MTAPKTRKAIRMTKMHEHVDELRKQLEKGSIQKAYKALLAYMMGLQRRFANKYGEAVVSGLYQGYMDMTYFAIFPARLKRQGLKVAIVFNYEKFQFEAWLAARNRKIQQETWERFKDGDWGEYRVVAPGGGIDSIIECDLCKDFDLDDAETLTARIEKGMEAFIERVEGALG
jgi:hypothetical protein